MIVDQDYWDGAYRTIDLVAPGNNDPLKQLIDEFVPMADKVQTAFEAGCFPGRYLLEVGRKGYVLSGCDPTPRVEELARWLNDQGCSIERIRRGNFEDEPRRSCYDLVCSFGFIEHFENYPEVFLHHCSMVKKGGLLFIEFPNFFGLIQRILHRLLDRDNYRNHVLKAMDVRTYQKLLPDDFELIYCGYRGGFDFWIDDYKRSNGKYRKQLLSFLFKTRALWGMAPDCSWYSPYGAVVARRKS